LLECIGYLSALDKVSIVQDNGRYRINSMFGIKTLTLSNIGGIVVRIQDVLGTSRI
jgi:hypothetical protein